MQRESAIVYGCGRGRCLLRIPYLYLYLHLHLHLRSLRFERTGIHIPAVSTSNIASSYTRPRHTQHTRNFHITVQRPIPLTWNNSSRSALVATSAHVTRGFSSGLTCDRLGSAASATCSLHGAERSISFDHIQKAIENLQNHPVVRPYQTSTIRHHASPGILTLYCVRRSHLRDRASQSTIITAASAFYQALHEYRCQSLIRDPCAVSVDGYGNRFVVLSRNIHLPYRRTLR